MIAGDMASQAARRPTVAAPRRLGFSQLHARARLRRRPAGRDRRGRRHAAVRLQRGGDPRSATARSTTAFGGYPARAALRAQGELDARRSRGCCATSAAPPTPTRSGRSRSRGAPASRRADIVFTGVGKSAAELECAVPLGLKAINVESAGELARVEAHRRAARHAGARRDPRQPRHRRQEPPAHLDRPQDQQVRRAARRGARAARRRWRGRPRAQAGRRPRARRLADHQPRAAARRGRVRRRRWPTSSQRARPAARVRRPRRRPRHLLRRRPTCRRRATTSRRSSTRSARPGCRSCVEPGRSIVGPAGVAGRARRRPQAARRRRASSRSSTPA